MFVCKRNGKLEQVHFDKITTRISKLCWSLPKEVNPILVAQKVILGLYNGVSTTELDELASETAANLSADSPWYAELASRIAVSNLHKSTRKNFSDVIQDLHLHINPKTKKSVGLISKKVFDFVQENAEILNGCIVYSRDNMFDYFGFKTLCRAYLFKINDKIVERPQHMIMRVACGIHCNDLPAAIETYNHMSQGLFIHGSSTLYNAGTEFPQLCSCFLLTIEDDSIEGIYNTLRKCALISKQSGGVGLASQHIRAAGSYIAGSNGVSSGIVPMLQVYNKTAHYVNQGGKRKGAFADYNEPWHADIFAWLKLKNNHGIEEHRARDLNYGLWIPDLFMRRVEADEDYCLFCPAEAPGLSDCWGEEHEKLYMSYEAQPHLVRQKIKARVLWYAILESQIETGEPYMLYKDSCNRNSNQQNLGTIRCSNLCTEIVEYTSPTEIAVCTLASIALPKFVKNKTFDFAQLEAVTRIVTRNLNKVIDINFYPVKEAETSNFRHRPIGIGVQGLDDAFKLMRFPFDSAEAAELNEQIFETIYYAACSESCNLAQKYGPYETFEGSPMSKGKFQFDLWGKHPSTRYDWETLRQLIMKHGIRNSLLVAPMPTASTSQILGNNECFEPCASNMYVRRTSAGEFICVSKHLVKDLVELNLWSSDLKNKIIANNGSVQTISEIPDDLKRIYKTVWEIKSKVIIDMSAARGPYICQSQSLNIHMPEPNFAKLTSLHFYGWSKGLKTGMYYLRTKAAADAIKFTIDTSTLQTDVKENLNEKLKKGNESIELVDNSSMKNNGKRRSVEWNNEALKKRKMQKEAEIYCSLTNRDQCDSCSG